MHLLFITLVGTADRLIDSPAVYVAMAIFNTVIMTCCSSCTKENNQREEVQMGERRGTDKGHRWVGKEKDWREKWEAGTIIHLTSSRLTNSHRASKKACYRTVKTGHID